LSRHNGHVAALLIEPLRIAALRNAVAEERQARSAQREQLVRIDGDISRRLPAKAGLLGSVLQKVSRHPVVLTGAREILDGLPKIAPV
jgi:hypothetical protein